MPRLRPSFNCAPLTSFVLAIACLYAGLAGLTACNSNQRNDTLHASVISVNALRVGFTTWDDKHQKQLVDEATSRDEAVTALAKYQQSRKPVLDSFEVAYRALALAATQADDFSLNAALGKVADLVAAVTALKGDLTK